MNLNENIPDASAVALPTVPAAIGAPLAGGIYAGMARGADGAPDYHLVLLPGDVRANWDDATSFAAAAGGKLPNRREQSLLFANLKDEFEEAWYWSSEQHADYAGYAWGQDFDDGLQTDVRKSYAGRARAVRRLPL